MFAVTTISHGGFFSIGTVGSFAYTDSFTATAHWIVNNGVRGRGMT